jgi:hypothetical protein
MCEDLELKIILYEEMPKPEYKDWSGIPTRNPGFKARRSHRFWLAENQRMDEFYTN